MALTSSDGPVRLFCGYHPEDRRFYKELSRHLAPFVDRGILQTQCSDGMLPGEVELQFLEKELANTEIIVLLVSPDLMGTKPSGDFWTNTLARLAPERLPLLLVEVRRMSLTDTCLEGRPLLPRRPRLPLVVHDDRESAWSKIAKKIRKAALDIRRPASGSVGNDRRPSGVMSLESVKSRRGLAYDLRYQGKSSEALQELLLALETLDTLSARDPASPLLKAERAHLHDRIGQCKYAQGNSPAALAAFDLAFEIRVQLAASLEDPAVLFDLSTSRFWRGYMSYVLGDLSRARDEQRAGMDLCRSLYTSDGNDLAARSLVVLETDLGTTLKELDDGLAAAKHLRNALAFARMLAGQKPESRQLRRDVSVGLFRLADLLVIRGEAEEAIVLCEESVRICWALSEEVPTNVQWRRHLATARLSLGDARLALGDLSRARGDYEFAAGTLGALAAMEPESLEGKRHHAAAERKLGELLLRAQDYHGALAAQMRAAGAMEAACARPPSDRWSRELEEIYSGLLEAHAVVPGADPAIADQVRTKAQKLRGRRFGVAA